MTLLSTGVSQSTVVHSELFKIQKLENLPENDVNCVFKDSKGFMWIGTLDGLHRYDGYSYKSYRIQNGNSICSNMIISIDEDSKGNIWIGTYGKGICVLDPVTEKFSTFLNENIPGSGNISYDVTCMMVDAFDFVWIGNLFGYTRVKLNRETFKIEFVDFIPIDSLPDYVSTESIKTIHQDKSNNVWLGTNLHTRLIVNPYEDVKKFKYKVFKVSAASICDYNLGIIAGGESINLIEPLATGEYSTTLIAFQTSTSLYYTNSEVWSGGRDGVSCFKKNDTGRWELTDKYLHDFSKNSISSNIITSISSDINNRIWIGTRGGGVNTINLRPKLFKCYSHSTAPGSVGNNMIRCIYEDSKANLWIGTEEAGVSVLLHDQRGNYTNGFKHLKVNNYVNENRAYAIKEMKTPYSKEHNSLVWVGTSFDTYLTAFNPETLKKKKLSSLAQALGFIFALEVQNDSVLWAGTYDEGLLRLTIGKDGDVKRAERFTPKSKSKSPIVSHIIRSLLLDSKGNLWIGTDKGINRLNAAQINRPSPEFEHFKANSESDYQNNDYILQILEAKNGKLWIGTMGAGLVCFEQTPKTKKSFFTIVNAKDGLPNNSIKGILEDDFGVLWLSSNSGLTAYNPANGHIVNYDVNDGLQNNEFSEIAACKRRNGDLIFGGNNGFNVFNSSSIVEDNTKPKLFFTDFYLFNDLINPCQEVDGSIILNQSIEYLKSIKLKYNQNSFSIGFVGLHYIAPQKNHYRYKLEGFDDKWCKASSQYRIAKYTNIPPGHYTFKVQGSNCDNIWVSQPISIDIIINPPIYKTMWAYVLYLIMILIISYFLYRNAKLIQRNKKKLLVSALEKKKIEELSSIKLQFFTNISHEFRTPLTLINAPLDKLIKDEMVMDNDARYHYYNLIKYNVNVLMRLINQLMDFRRLDQNKLNISASEQNLISFLDVIYHSFIPLAQQKNISFKFKYPQDELMLWFDTDKIEKVMYNLLSNAFKFTPSNGTVILKVELNQDGKEVLISVKDSGVGIDLGEELKIFERYYQTSNKSKFNFGGTGIGLAYSKGVVELHNGEIWGENAKDKGAVFFVKLQTGCNHLSNNLLIKEKLDFSREIESVLDNKEGNEFVIPVNKKKSESVLIVEDNVELRKHLVDIFNVDYIVYEAEDGQVGLKMCREHYPSLVITDIMMPVMSGIELCQQLKEDEEISHIPVLILTAKDTDESHVEGLEIGADGYLSKPFSSDVLLANVASLIASRALLRARYLKEIEIHPEIIGNTPADTKFMDKIMSIIESELANSDFTVEDLADRYGVSRVYLNRKIKALTNETSNQFLRNIRLKHAAELLKQNVLTVAEVTWRVGYNDLRTFRSRFKEVYGVSPSEYAKEQKKDV